MLIAYLLRQGRPAGTIESVTFSFRSDGRYSVGGEEPTVWETFEGAYGEFEKLVHQSVWDQSILVLWKRRRYGG